MVVVRDMFVLACWTGARISDIKRMPEMVSEAWKNNGGHVLITSRLFRPKPMPLSMFLFCQAPGM